MRDGFIRLEGTLSCNKLSRDGWISCHTRISFLKWNQLKNDIQKVTNTFELAYDISDINFGEISENDNTIECNIDFGLAAYDLVYTAN
jgi:hypothetical protein